MSETEDSKPFRFVPKTGVGKALLALYLVAFVAIAVSVTGVAFNEPRMLGPMPEVALWMYIWFGVINVVLLGTYVYLFRPWAEAATRFVDSEEAEWESKQREGGSPEDPVIASPGED